MTAPQPPTIAPPLRVAVVTAYPPSRNSLAEYGRHLVRHLAEHDGVSEVRVVADRDAAGATAPPGVTVRPVWRFNALGTALAIRRAVRGADAGLVIFNVQFASFGDRKVPGALGLLAPLLCRRRGRPVIVLLHNLADSVDLAAAGFTSNPLLTRLMKAAGRVLTRALLTADLVALTLPRYVEFVRQSYGADNVVLTPHGSFETVPAAGVLAAVAADAAASGPLAPSTAGPHRVLAFGKFGTYKRLEVMLEAHRILRARRDDVELVLAGTDSPNAAGYMASLARRYAELPGVVFTGYVPEEDVPALFRAATVVAFPYTATTGSSGVLHQAGEFGRATVLPRIGELVDVIEDEGFAGEYFDPGDAAGLAAALERVLDDDGRRAELERRNRAAALGVGLSDVVHWHLLHARRLREEAA